MNLFKKIYKNRYVLDRKIVSATINLIDAKACQRLQAIRGQYIGNSVHAFWWTGYRNFGDLITPYLLNYYDRFPIYAKPQFAEVAATGSLLGMLPQNYNGMILGSGLLSDTHKLSFPDATILSVRGPLTKSRINAPKNTEVGDPGLLMTELIPERKQKNTPLDW